MSNFLGTVISLVLGTVIMVNGVSTKTDDIIAAAKLAANQANVHQFETALELYYLDHGSYPGVSGGAALVSELKNDGYVTGTPLDPTVFTYTPKDGGQSYTLSLAGN